MPNNSKSHNFVHLRVHSSYSLASGAITVDKIAQLANKYNMPAIALSDHGNLFGLLEFSLNCQQNGVQPIIACEVNIALESNNQLGAKNNDNLLLIAKNNQGYQNLIILVSNSFLTQEAAANDNHVNIKDLIEHKEGIIALVGHPKSLAAQLILDKNNQGAKNNILYYKEIFTDHLYVEVMRHGLQPEELINEQLINIAQQNNIALVATNDVYFSSPELYEAHDVLSCIAHGRYASEKNRAK